ncbi:hypothetical protein [Limnofasciculus baicalensis]|uniref:Uncharacterized protein n=1 Tax=Limnofasciculus baicalensis BBK-W-15 TaxID=2699891 RepID=A0AAE3KR82_9CYAN|nr:hypothetical protein [Limnofasciculus baicalensis]MCP2732586.1 hypothetical protein [Limnofasciculus baicalensis BBK-W-15]
MGNGDKSIPFLLVGQARRLSLDRESLDLENGTAICFAAAQAIARVNLPRLYHRNLLT